MKKNSGQVFFLLLIFSWVSILSGQDIHFSQYNYSTIYLNPALTSAYKKMEATIQYKQQWKVVNGYSTGAASFESKLNQRTWKKLKKLTNTYKQSLGKGPAIGVNIFSDKAGNGSIKQNIASLSLAYHALLTRNVILSGGVNAGIGQLSIATEDLRWNNQYFLGNYNSSTPSEENFANTSHIYPDFGAGVLWSYVQDNSYMKSNDQKFVNAGISVSHINQPNLSFYAAGESKLFRKWTFHAASLIGIKNSDYSFGASLLVLKQLSATEFTTGILVRKIFSENAIYTSLIKESALSIGCYYRNKDAVIPYLLFEMDRFAFGLSYDINSSSFVTATKGRGGFEISLRYVSKNTALRKVKG